MQIISTGYSRSINLMIMLGFFTSTAMQRLFTMQTTIPGTGNMKRVLKNYSLNYSIFPFPGTAKSITLFISSLKSDIPEASETRIQNSATTYTRWYNDYRFLFTTGSNDHRTICAVAALVVDFMFQISLSTTKKTISRSVCVGKCRCYCIEINFQVPYRE